MNLLCRIEHLHGQNLLVEGHNYFIGDNGVCCDLTEEHANVLLDQADAWCAVHPEDITRVQDEGDPFRNTAQPAGMAHIELPPGEELRLPKNLGPVQAKVPGRRGRPKKVQTP